LGLLLGRIKADLISERLRPAFRPSLVCKADDWCAEARRGGRAMRVYSEILVLDCKGVDGEGRCTAMREKRVLSFPPGF
jgi:hypothetical protein